MEAVAAGARAGGVRVVDREALLLDGVDEVDGGAAQVRGAHAVGDDLHTVEVLLHVAVERALSVGVLILGVYLRRRMQRRAQSAVAGTVAAIALFIGAGAVFGDLLPFSSGNRPPQEPEVDLPNVRIQIVAEGDAIELTLPKALVQASSSSYFGARREPASTSTPW